MSENNNNQSFNYSYDASRKEELEMIKAKYTPAVESKMDQLRRLDKKAEKKGMMVSITVGTLSMLLFGFGLSCVTVWDRLFILGIVAGIIGFAGMGIAYMLYNVITKNERERMAPEILKLVQELSEGDSSEH